MKPTPFGRYLLLQKLAVGGTGEIYRAKLLGVEGFEKEVVIKRILPPWGANPHFISMLIDEAKILVKLQHERIVQVYELGKEDDIYYISMEYVKGWDLRHLIRHSKEHHAPFQISECLYVISEILKGLDYIHKQKDKHGLNLDIIHRDISPQNILVSEEGILKIADFGIAHARSRTYETSTGVIKGKFSYMSPEQARGETLNYKTDLFATGILFYELLTHQKLFSGKVDLKVLDQVRSFKVEDILKNLQIPFVLQKILKRSLAENMIDRYSSAQEFLKEIQEAIETLEAEQGEEIFKGRLLSLPKPEEIPTSPELQKLPKAGAEEGFTQAIVSREWGSDTSLEITRELEKAFNQTTDRDPALELDLVSKKIKPERKIAYPLFLILLLILLTVWFFLEKKQSLQTQSVAATAETRAPSPLTALPLPETLKSLAPETQKTTAPYSEKEKTPPPPVMKGALSVRASPWGKISVSGIVSGSEKPFYRSIPYGNYLVSVKYQNAQGDWKSVARSVKISKATTACSASFQKEGQGILSCQ